VVAFPVEVSAIVASASQAGLSNAPNFRDVAYADANGQQRPPGGRFPCLTKWHMGTEQLEYKLVIDDDPDAEVLGRLAHFELGAAAFMAAVAKFPNRNIQLRQGTRVIKRHDGEPKLALPAPVAPNLKSWSVHLIRGEQMEWLGFIDASDRTSATQQAIKCSP
jgi:hypothetical protein